MRARILALAVQYSLASVWSKMCTQVRKEDLFFLELGISCA